MDLQAQADAFRAQTPGDDVDPTWNLMSGMTLPKSFKTEFAHPQAPVFTHMNDNNFPNLYSDDKIVIYLNSALPYPEAYPGAEGRAAMSFVHLLVVPRERVYNIATMRGQKDHDLLMYMKNVTLAEFGQYQFRKRIQQAAQKQNLEDAPDDITCEYIDAHNYAMRYLMKAKESDLSFWFHEHPTHSVGHLHMHVLLDTTLTKAFTIHSHKNIPFTSAVKSVHERDPGPSC